MSALVVLLVIIASERNSRVFSQLVVQRRSSLLAMARVLKLSQ